MDKKNTAIGLILLIVGFGLMYMTAPEPQAPAPANQNSESAPEAKPASTTTLADPAELVEAEGLADPAAMLAQAETAAAEVLSDFSDDAPVFLENDYVRIELSRKGASVVEVGFKKTDPDREIDTFIFNEGAKKPALGLYFDAGQVPQPFLSEFQLISQASDRVVFQWDAPKGNYSLQRIFALNGGEERPYHIAHETIILNTADVPLRLPDMFFGLGTAFPLDTDPAGQYLNFMTYASGSVEKVKVDEFTGSKGIFGFGAKTPKDFSRQSHANVTWAAAKNQYFASLLIPNEPLNTTVYTEGMPYGSPYVAGAPTAGVFGAVSYASPTVQPDSQASVGMTFYIGPKELTRLRDIGGNTVEVMEFGPLVGWISEILLLVMSWYQGYVGNWGIAIILLTVSIKLIFWWLTSKGMVTQKISAKKMQGLAEPMKALREKHANNPQKLQKEMMELYRKYDVNPLAAVAGCLPILIQMPIFFGLFWMLRTAAELRLENFLWIQDLAMPDRLFIFPFEIPFLGNAFNILPILYGATSYFQMRMTPQPAAMDEQQQMMQSMFKIMPWIFALVLYNFAAALSLYWIANNLITMTQMALVNKKIKPQLDQIEAEQEERRVAEARPVKAVAKKSKKK